jgi:hypothetical protein
VLAKFKIHLVRTSRGQRIAVAALLSLLVLLPACAGSTPQSTSVRFYYPYAYARVASDLRVTKTVAGECFTQSLSVSGAYRCMADGTLYDPCFLPIFYLTAPDSVVCATAPWDPEVVALTLTSPLMPGTSAVSIPWALELSTGARCIVDNGARDVINNTLVAYICNAPNSGATLVDQSSQPWTVSYASSIRASATPMRLSATFSPADVLTVWY